MKKNLFIVSVSCLLMSLSSCVSLQGVSFERLQAADISFPEQVRTVGVVNCVPQHNQDKKAVEYSPGVLMGDGKIVAEALAHEIASTDYFNQVVICDSVLSGTGEQALREHCLSGEWVDSLTQSLGVDMLLSVEYMPVQLQEGSMFLEDFMQVVPTIDGIVSPTIRVYAAKREEPLYTISKTDTICWTLTPQLAYEQVIKEASEYAASLPVKYLLPYWKEVDRFYFDGGNVYMRDAGVCVREQDWEQASLLWKKAYEEKKGKAKMRAAFNLALYHEFMNDFEQAKAYLEIAMNLTPEDAVEKPLLEFYHLQLEEQSTKYLRLKIQMKRFEP